MTSALVCRQLISVFVLQECKQCLCTFLVGECIEGDIQSILTQLPEELGGFGYGKTDATQSLNVLKHFFWCAVRYDVTLRHDDQTVCLSGFVHVVGDEEDRKSVV